MNSNESSSCMNQVTKESGCSLGCALKDEASNRNFESRLKEMRQKCGLSQKRLAGEVGVKTSTIQRYENGNLPTGQHLLSLSEALGVSLDWLLKGERFKEEGPEDEHSTFEGLSYESPELKMVPKVLARLNAGGGSLETDDNVQGMYGFRYDWIKTKGDPSKMVLMDVSGDSMMPEIRDGDTVLIDQGQKDVFVGKIYAVSIDQEIVVKYVEKLPGKLVLRSVNRKWSDIEVDIRGDLGDSVQFIGRVVWLGRELA
mgnify:FL=1